MSKITILVFSAFLCLAWGWEPGTQYVYNYAGRAINGIYRMKQQNAVVEINSRVIVQSQDENTIVVKLTDGRIKRTGKFEKNPFINGDDKDFELNPAYKEEIQGQEDQIVNPEHFGAPFVVTLNKGSVTGIKVGADEPLWVVNYKKSIASQLQLDITSVRPDGKPVDWSSMSNEDAKSATFNVFEDSVTGDCSNVIAVHPLPYSKLYQFDVYKNNPKYVDEICEGKPVYEIIKTKDFNRCLHNPAAISAQPAGALCALDKAYCEDFLQRSSVYRYVACGSIPKLTYLAVVSLSDLIVKPFAIDTEELTSSSSIRWELVKKESLSSRLSTPSNPKEYKTLSYVFPEYEQDEDPTDTTFVQPKLEEAFLKSPIPVQKLQQTIYEALRYVAKDLKEKPDSESDNLERLATIGRALPMFTLPELRGFWQQIKKEDPVVVTLFIDTVVQSGSNPAIMLIKELVENKEVSELKATWAVAALGMNAKTPTTELLHELVNFYKSSTVQSSKTLKQTALMTLADLFHSACTDYVSSQRFPQQLGDLCDEKDPVVLNEFLPLLVKELKSSNTPAERIVALTAFGALGTKEIIPILVPYIRGSGDFNDTAERTRAILSLYRVSYAAPEQVHPILTSLATNTEERPEVRMAAITLLFSTNAPFSIWQKLAVSSWFERSHQVVSFIHSLTKSFTQLETISPIHKEIVEKANHAFTLVKPVPFGVPFSFFDLKSSYLEEGLGAIMDTHSYRVADETWPVFFANRYFYQFGPIMTQPATILFWNYNMGGIWKDVMGKLYGNAHGHDTFMARNHNSENIIKNVWDELKVAPRPSDKRVGLLHVNLMGSVNRFFDLEKIAETVPSFLSEMMKYQNKPYEVNVTKYRMLGEYNLKFPTETGFPMRFLANLPILVSLQGQVKLDGYTGIKTDISAELSWKMTSELRVELPFNGNYIATGVDVRVESRLPKDLTYNYEKGQIKVTWTPGSKTTDLLYYHVKPYTATRNIAESHKPIMEDEKAHHIITVNDQPTQRNIPLGDRYGVNLHLMTHSELDFSDFSSWAHWIKKWDINGISNVAFVPLDLKHREYVLRYKPEGTKAKTVQTWFHYQQATKSCQHTVVFQTGESQPTKSSPGEIISYTPIAPEFQPTSERVFKNMESGNAHFIRAGLTVEQKDGTFVHFNSTLGLSKDSWYTKDFTDFRIEKYTTTGPSSSHGSKKVDYAMCYWAVRNWNNPPQYGFSKDVLYLTDDETISFGENCDQSKIRFKAKVYRDEYAAKHALYSPVGQRCQKDMAQGFMYGSPACEQARDLDQTYNNYELFAEAEKEVPQPLAHWLNAIRKYVNHALFPYTVEHKFESNSPNRASWQIKYDPSTGASNMTFVRPSETLVAHNVRIPEDYKPFSPLSVAYFQSFYPLYAGKNFIDYAVNLTSGGASEDKCFVGPKAVYTFDKAFYNYTVDQCEHVLLTDCSQKHELAVIAHQEGQYKVVKVIYGNDTVELNPATGYVSINGAKTSFKGLDKDSRFEIRKYNNKKIKAVVYPSQEALIFEIPFKKFIVKVQGSQVELSAPRQLRGKTCGMCGDYNQETDDEFKTPERCALSAGELMAASFKLTSGQGCQGKQDEVSRRLAKETQTCQQVDTHSPTYLPEVDLSKPTKCTRYEKLSYEGTHSSMSCQSVETSPKCQPGCKPHVLITKQFTFKCSGGMKDFTTVMTVPSSCVVA